MLISLATVVSGCGSPQPVADSAEVRQAVSQDQRQVESARKTEAADSGAVSRADQVWEDATGRKYIGRVPYDVFFDNPLELAASTAQKPGTVSADSSAPVSRSGETADDASDTARTDWDHWLPVDVLESEVKAARNYLNQKLQSVGSYNTSVTMIPPQIGTIAVLAAIIEEYSGEVSWKDDAALIRDLAARMTASPLKRGPKDQRRLLQLFENLTDTLNRSRPAGLELESPDASWSESADMGLVMSRLESASQRLRTEVTESGFATQQQQVRHEASILAGLMKAMTTESYGYADDAEFLGHSKALMDSALEIREAAEAGDFSQFDVSVSEMAAACQACHRDYRTN